MLDELLNPITQSVYQIGSLNLHDRYNTTLSRVVLHIGDACPIFMLTKTLISTRWVRFMLIHQTCSRGGVTKAPFVNFSVSKIFDLAKVTLELFDSHLCSTGATAAELRRHLSNINVIFKT